MSKGEKHLTDFLSFMAVLNLLALCVSIHTIYKIFD